METASTDDEWQELRDEYDRVLTSIYAEIDDELRQNHATGISSVLDLPIPAKPSQRADA